MTLIKTETRGGARPNAGRKKGSSVYGESTQAMRVPESLVPIIKSLLDGRKTQFEQLASNSVGIFFPAKTPSVCKLPLFGGKVAAGFPSPADDYVEKSLDLNELLVQKPAATFAPKGSQCWVRVFIPTIFWSWIGPLIRFRGKS